MSRGGESKCVEGREEGMSQLHCHTTPCIFFHPSRLIEQYTRSAMSSILKTVQTRLELLVYGDSHASCSFHPAALFLGGIGFLYLTSLVSKIVNLLLDVYVLPGTPLSKYGASRSTATSSSRFKTWAVVTGATDGIGREFALQLARAGFNVLLASRSADKLDKVAIEIKAINPSIETKAVAIDFSLADKAQYATLEKAVGAMNVGVLVNNVGKSHEMPVPFAETSLDEMLSISEINVNATLRVTRMIVPNMVKQ
jgi:17beta-estradiol 17-dehydrogenase / very-long-chain 3-oxoacyl-CoA reductase